MSSRKSPSVARRGTPASDLVIRSGLPGWVVQALRNDGLRRMGTVAGLSDDEILAIPGIGCRALQIIRFELQRWASDASARQYDPPISK
jgi:hypothetical protein